MAPKGMSSLRPPSDVSSEDSGDLDGDEDYSRLLDAVPLLALDSPLRPRQRRPTQAGLGAASIHTKTPEDDSRSSRKMNDSSPHQRPHSYHGNQYSGIRYSSSNRRYKTDADLESYPSFSDDSFCSVSTEYTSNAVSGLQQFDQRVKEMIMELRRERNRLIEAYKDQSHHSIRHETESDQKRRRSFSLSPRNLLRKVKSRMNNGVESSPRSPQSVDGPISPRGSLLKPKGTTGAARAQETSNASKGKSSTETYSAMHSSKIDRNSRKASVSGSSERSNLSTSPRSRHSKKLGHTASNKKGKRRHRSLSPRNTARIRDDVSLSPSPTKRHSSRHLISNADTRGKRPHDSHSLTKKLGSSVSGRSRRSRSPRNASKDGRRTKTSTGSHPNKHRSLSPNKMGRNQSLTWTSNHLASDQRKTQHGESALPRNASDSARSRVKQEIRSLCSTTPPRKERQQHKRNSSARSRRRHPSSRSTATQTDDSILSSFSPPSIFAKTEENLSPTKMRKPRKVSQVKVTTDSGPTPTLPSHEEENKFVTSYSSLSAKSNGSSSRSSRSSPRVRNSREKDRPKRDFIDSIDWRMLSPQIHEGEFLRQDTGGISQEHPMFREEMDNDQVFDSDRTLALVRKWSRAHVNDPYTQSSQLSQESQPSLQSKSLHSSMSRLSLGNHNNDSLEQAKLRRSSSLRHDLHRDAASPLKELTLDIFQF